MIANNSFLIRPLTAADAPAVSDLLNRQSPEYKVFFYAFKSDAETIAEILSAARKDVYTGIFWNDTLASFFMLRGWDEGYEYPSLGVFVSEDFRGKRLLPLMIESTKVICKLAGVKKFIAKSHPSNTGLKNITQLGFREVGIEEGTGNTLWHVDL